jgi:transposase
MTCTPSKSWSRRWVVERVLAWITRYRRTVRDCERLLAHHEA